METLLKRLFLLSLLITPMTSTAFEVVPANSAESLCYSQAMIGFDSVINSRLGVPPEHALDLAILNQRTVATSERVYSMALLKTILDAYLWEESPHSYAVKVFYRCAQEDTRLKSAQNDFLTIDF